MSKEQTKALVPALRFPGFEGEWFAGRLSDQIYKLDAGVSVNSEDSPAEGTDMGILKTSCVSAGVFDPLENKYVKNPIEIERLREPVQKNTIIISRMNTPALVGANAFVGNDFPNLFLPDRLWAAKIKPDHYPKWVSKLTTSYRIRSIFSARGTGTSGSMKNITKSDVLTTPIMYPSYPEQKKIAAFLGAVDDKIAQLEKKKDLLKAYKKGCMQKLFSQEIRFKDDDGKGFQDWEEATLEQLVTLSAGTSKSKHISDDGIRYIVDMGSVSTSGHLIPSKKTDYSSDLLKAGQLVMPKDDIGGGLIIGRVGLIDQDDKYVLGDHVYLLSNIKCNPLFLSYKINSFEINKSFRRKANGTAQLGLARNSVLTQLVKIPKHAKEQKKIADFLSAIDQKIDLVSKELNQAKAFKKGLLQQMFV